MPKSTRANGANGDDTLVGAAGRKFLSGGRGNDTYYVDSPDVSIREKFNGGTDTVVASVDWMLEQNVENLELAGDADLNGTGNELGNQMTGNSGANVIDGGEGDDVLNGGGGDDTLIGGAGTDTAIFDGSASDFTFLWDSEMLTIVHADGQTDTLSGIELLSFDDGLIDTADIAPTDDPAQPPEEPLPPDPVAVADQETGSEDGVLVLDVLRNDLGNGLTLVEVTQGSMGATAINSDGTITYTPAPQASGSDQFTYTIADDLGRISTASVAIDILAENDAPLAADDAFQMTEGEVLISTTSLLANDSDADGDALSVLAYDETSAGGGTVSVDTEGAFTYTPPEGFTGDDTFTYMVGDTAGATDTATVTVAIAASSSGGGDSETGTDETPLPTPAYITELISENDWMRLNYPNEVGTGITVTYAFMEAAPGYYGDPGTIDATFQAFSAQQEDVARAMLADISSFADITFVEVASALDATIAFGMTDLGVDNLGLAWLPQGDATGTHHSDVWIDVDVGGDEIAQGTDAYWALLHEIGHAVGLEHPSLPAEEENHQYTVMERAPHQGHTLIEGDLSGFQLYDVAALQHLYGANVSEIGDSVYSFSDFDEQLETIWDAGGHDTIDMRAAEYGVEIDLNGGTFSTVSEAGFDNIALAHDTMIEDAFGGAFGDVIRGNEADNRIDGGAGDDTMAGGDGADTYAFSTSWGQDTITDFSPLEDRLDFSAGGLTLEDLLITAVDGDTLITDGENSLRLSGVDSVEDEFDESLLLF